MESGSAGTARRIVLLPPCPRPICGYPLTGSSLSTQRFEPAYAMSRCPFLSACSVNWSTTVPRELLHEVRLTRTPVLRGAWPDSRVTPSPAVLVSSAHAPLVLLRDERETRIVSADDAD